VGGRTTARGRLTSVAPPLLRGLDPAPAADPGLYGPGSEAWRLNREAMLLLGAGPRALLLQIAHPLVAEGVDQHSTFREDPWRRLAATLRSYLTIVYGPTSTARTEVRRLNALHRGITGPIRDAEARATHGSRYRARDPGLALWVHATLVDSTIAVHDAWIEPLARDRRARFYAETRPIGRALGIPDTLLPTDLEAFEGYVAGMLGPGGPVRVSPTARELAGIILRPPLAPLFPAIGLLLQRVPIAAHAWTLWPAVGLLPPSVRADYGFAWGLRERAVAAWLTAGLRGWRPLLPRSLRTMPQALAADRRVAGVSGR